MPEILDNLPMNLDPQWPVYGLLIVFIASVHLWASRFEIRTHRYRAQWTGFMGGISLGYVCLYMLPKLSQAVQNVGNLYPDSGFLLQYFVYYILLTSILLFLAAERVGKHSEAGATAARWMQISSHGIYCFLIGYIAVELPLPKVGLHVLASIILATHLLGMVIHLREHSPDVHTDTTKWLFSLSVVAGYLLGVVTQLPVIAIMSVSSFVAGSILVNVISDELPRADKGRMQWFLVGTGIFVVSSIALRSG